MTEGITVEQVRELRRAYDALPEAERASLKRCPDAQAILANRAFWQVAGWAPDDLRLRLAHLIACFPAASQSGEPDGFKVGLFLREALHPGRPSVEPAEAVRYRQLVGARDIDELVPRMKRILAEAARPIDWGVLGRDMFQWSDQVRKSWDKDFYGTP